MSIQAISHVNFRSLPGGDIWNWVDHFDRSVVSFEFIGLLDYWIIGTIWYYIIYRTFTILKLYTGLLDWSWVTFQKKHKKSKMSDVRCETWSMVNVITRPRIKSTRYYQDTFVARWPSGVSNPWIFPCSMLKKVHAPWRYHHQPSRLSLLPVVEPAIDHLILAGWNSAATKSCFKGSRHWKNGLSHRIQVSS